MLVAYGNNCNMVADSSSLRELALEEPVAGIGGPGASQTDAVGRSCCYRG